MRQCTLFEFSRIGIVPAEGWMHEHTDGRAWIYRTNAEAVVRDMGGLPSGAGLWPRIMPTRKTGSWKEWDLHVWQCRGSGPFTKLIRTDGTTFDEFRPYRVEYVNGKSTERAIDVMTCDEADGYASEGQFPPGSMLPKIQAIVDYVRTTGNEGIITDPEHLSDAISGCGGTRIVR